MGAIETVMLDLACSQVGKHFGLPTHGYMVATESKCVDAQAGMESATSAALGALAGINMISGAGMLDSLACHSPEKLVLDAETIAMAQRLLQGVQPRSESLALDMFAKAGPLGDFLKLPDTRKLFRVEQHIPSKVIDRHSLGTWEQEGKRDAFARAKVRVQELLATYKRPQIPTNVEQSLREKMLQLSQREGLDHLPGI